MNGSGSYVRWFKDIRLEDVSLVGGKTASLGELYSALSPQGVRVPNGFALTAAAYRDALTQAGAWDELRALLAGLDKRRISDLARRAAAARAIVYAATDQETLRREVAEAYRQLEGEYGAQCRGRRAQFGHRRRPADRELCGPARQFPQYSRAA